MSRLEPIFRRAITRGLYTFVVAFVVLSVPCLIGREDFDLEALAAFTIGVAVMGYDWFDFECERRRKSGRVRPLFVLGMLAAGTALAVAGLRFAYQPDTDRAIWTRDGVQHATETRLYPWDEPADHHRRICEALLARKL